jgi:hypothetical protein
MINFDIPAGQAELSNRPEPPVLKAFECRSADARVSRIRRLYGVLAVTVSKKA